MVKLSVLIFNDKNRLLIACRCLQQQLDFWQTNRPANEAEKNEIDRNHWLRNDRFAVDRMLLIESQRLRTGASINETITRMNDSKLDKPCSSVRLSLHY